MTKEIKNVLVANRGVPAVRIMHACRDRQIKTTAVYSSPDRVAHHVYMADSAVYIGEGPPLESYLNVDRIIEAAKTAKADAVHPGWGFLAENEHFARRVIDEGLIWIGPPPEVINSMGDKIEAKKLAEKAGVPTIPGLSDVKAPEEVFAWMADKHVEYPLMIKPALGGGGKGMIRVDSDGELRNKLDQARSESMKSFGDDKIMVEKYVERGRHLEVQIVADKHGHVCHLFERECTLQRRNQKIIEEAPAPTLDDDIRYQLWGTAVALMRMIGYQSAGTVEFLYDCPARKFYFLEVNTRLQVEHSITELATGLDLVNIMLDVAMDRPLPISQDQVRTNRHALEVRVNAEDPATFNPSFGTISRFLMPHGPAVRVISGVFEGAEVPPYYDSLVMLLMTSGAERADAVRVMDRALGRNLRVEGIKTNAPLLLSIIRHPDFIAGDFSTRFIEEHMDELISMFRGEGADDEIVKIAEYVARVSALGPQEWM